jgi:hypothetical protein
MEEDMTMVDDTFDSPPTSPPPFSATTNGDLRPRPAPLPAKIDEWTRYLKKQRTLNDYVEDIHRVLWDSSEEYRDYLEAVYDEDAVEGSTAVDDTFAAMLIREKARTMEGSPVADKKVNTIKKALNVVLNRYHFSRKRRKNTVGGEYVPPDTAHNDVSGD